MPRHRVRERSDFIDRGATNAQGLSEAVEQFTSHVNTMLQFVPNYYGVFTLELKVSDGLMSQSKIGGDRQEKIVIRTVEDKPRT